MAQAPSVSSIHAYSRSRVLVGAAGAAGAAVALLKLRHGVSDGKSDRVARHSSQALRLAQPQEFQHPYSSKPVLWRLFVTVRRSLFLLYIFLPLAKAALLDALFAGTSTGEHYHARFLDVLFDAMASGGCSTQKFGQWISMRPDIFPADIVQRLSTLRCDGTQR